MEADCRLVQQPLVDKSDRWYRAVAIVVFDPKADMQVPNECAARAAPVSLSLASIYDHTCTFALDFGTK
jgi:hypothetical protein